MDKQKELEMLLTAKDVAELLSVGVRTVWRWAAIEKLPRPISLGKTVVRWRASDMQKYLDALSS